MARAVSHQKWLPLLRKRRSSGFTLTELLIAILVGGIITTILLSIVVALLQTNQREAARSDTQREVQMALDYISRDLREAVYVYDGNCLVADPKGTFDGMELDCRGLLSALPPKVAGGAQTVPVLAFWKTEGLPESIQNNCVANAADLSKPPAEQSLRIRGVPCVSNRMYSLIVYTLNWDNDPKWKGKARIMRYKLPQFMSNAGSGSGIPPITQGWLYPLIEGVGFENWPKDREGKSLAGYVAPTDDNPNTRSNYQVLLDYIDINGPRNSDGQSVIEQSKLCPDPKPAKIPASEPEDSDRYQGGYVLTPSSAIATKAGNDGRGFYVCVNGGESYGRLNQEVVVRINGNAAGRPGLPRDRSDVPIQIETRVLTRGVINKSL